MKKKENVGDLLFESTKLMFRAMGIGIKKIYKKRRSYFPFWLAYTFIIVGMTWHHRFLISPSWGLKNFVSWKIVKVLGTIPWPFFCSFFFLSFFFVLSFIAGFGDLKKILFYQKKLNLIGFRNDEGMYPKVLSISHPNEFKTTLVIKSEAVGIDRYETRIRDLEASFAQMVDSITNGGNPQIIVIQLTQKKLTKEVQFQGIKSSLKSPYNFILGESMKGPMVYSLESLPHMLIAGTTGGGKSVFMKQALIGILKTSSHLQTYLLDLKRGVETKEFSVLPNVRVAKNEDEAVLLLQKLKEEMDRRFVYLEKNGHKEIRPQRDKMDKILVGIDEASVLYTKVGQKSNKGYLIQKARELTDELTKLGRAAGIHLIFATQKVTKETIDTKVQENIGGRMCFRMNTLQGSMTVLGNKMAFELPDVRGRGIWASGQDFLEIQAPYISEEEIREELEAIDAEFRNKKKMIYGKMIEISVEKDLKKNPLPERYFENV